MTRPKITSAILDAQNGNWLAAVAWIGLYAFGFASGKGLCQRWVRQVIQALHGGKYDRYHGATAQESMELWARSPFAVDPESGSMIGDILYKRGTARQPEGHVGIRIKGNRVAENSSVHGGKNGARGVRSLRSFGHVDLIVRLPNK